MKSTRKVLNFTDRKTIDRAHVTVRIVATGEDVSPKLSVSLRLDSYRFSPEARIFVEVYFDNLSKVFDWGSVASPSAPRDCSLDHLKTHDHMLVTIRVVDYTDHSQPGRIAGICKQIPASSQAGVRSLLPNVGDSELRGELWRLDIMDDDGPLIRVNSSLIEDRNGFVRSPAFLTLVFPSVLRQIADWALGDSAPDEDETDSARGRWIRWMLDLTSKQRLPSEIYPRGEAEDVRLDFINELVAVFDRENKLQQKYLGAWFSANSREMPGPVR